MPGPRQDRSEDEIRNINIADRSPAGPEMYDGRTDLNWASGIFLANFGGEHWESIKVEHDHGEQKQILVTILILIPRIIVDLSSTSK